MIHMSRFLLLVPLFIYLFSAVCVFSWNVTNNEVSDCARRWKAEPIDRRKHFWISLFVFPIIIICRLVLGFSQAMKRLGRMFWHWLTDQCGQPQLYVLYGEEEKRDG